MTTRHPKVLHFSFHAINIMLLAFNQREQQGFLVDIPHKSGCHYHNNNVSNDQKLVDLLFTSLLSQGQSIVSKTTQSQSKQYFIF